GLAVLVAVDMLSFGVMRELLRAVREHALLGAAVAERIQLGFPTGSLNGWQYAVALFVGLVVVGAYGPGDQRRDPRRLFAACALATALPLCGYVTDKQFQDVVDVALAGGCQVLAVPRAAEVAGVHPTTVWRRGQPLVQLTAPSLKGPQLIAKRALDLIGAGIGLVVLSP